MKIKFPDLENKVGYHKYSLGEAARIRVKKLLGRTLSPKNHTAQISEIYTMIKVLNKLIKLGHA
ncbi:hypothetical protein [Candidatus Enterovibrio altilux]|uniref:hypothetical protein n=1 Tax=Candidatus Enterovibrio altilux TaxID=1927128 RepID=UPI000BBCEB56|nr:hypothetical protein [Candidatus Enterovibrio luxaltus]